MKKKLVAIVALVLIVVLTCSLAACNKSDSMFDGNFKKEATSEEASSTWKTAQTALGKDSSELATASDDEDSSPVKGWKGMKVSMDARSNSTYVVDGVSNENITIMQAEGALLFDGSAVAVTSKMGMSSSKDDKTESSTVSVGTFVKDKTIYTNLTLSEKEAEKELQERSLKLKYTTDLDPISQAIINKLPDYEFSETVIDAIAEVILDMTYDELVSTYDGFKAYVDNSGDYNRVKYVLTAQMVADLNGEGEEFVKNAVLGECSIIIVTDKATGAFQGAKFETNTTITTNIEGSDVTISAKASCSIENCSEITSYPEDLDSYKDIKNITTDDIVNILNPSEN